MPYILRILQSFLRWRFNQFYPNASGISSTALAQSVIMTSNECQNIPILLPLTMTSNEHQDISIHLPLTMASNEHQDISIHLPLTMTSNERQNISIHLSLTMTSNERQDISIHLPLTMTSNERQDISIHLPLTMTSNERPISIHLPLTMTSNEHQDISIHLPFTIRGIHWWLMKSPQKGTIKWKAFPCHDVMKHTIDPEMIALTVEVYHYDCPSTREETLKCLCQWIIWIYQ